MANGEDWLLRPVLNGLCRYESLKNGELDLGDIARMNDALNVSNENQARMVAG
jgi:flagellar biosynthesis/type III secretory pathway chaperone